MPDIAGCNPIDVVCLAKKGAGAVKDKATDAATSAVSDMGDDFIGKIAKSVIEGVGKVASSLGTAWVNVGTPTLSGGKDSGAVAGSHADATGLITVMGWVKWLAIAVCVGSLMVVGAQMALRARHGEGERIMGRMQWVLAGTVIISAGVAVVTAAVPQSSVGGTVGFLQNSMFYYSLAFMILGVIIGGAKMAWDQRAEPGKEVLRALLTLIVVTGVGATGVTMLVAASDSFSVWILNGSTDCNVGKDGACFGRSVSGMLSVGAALGPLGAFLAIVFALLAVLVTVIQIFLMVARAGMIVILLGVLPITAASSATKTGKQAFQKACGWLLAVILYKPAASIVYSAAFRLTGTDLFGGGKDKLISFLAGLTLMIVSLFAIGALMALVVPTISQLSTGGAMMAGATSAMVALPGGAIPGGRLMGGGGGSSSAPGATLPSGGSKPSPSSGGPTSGGDSGPSGSQGMSGSNGSTPGKPGPGGAGPSGASGGTGAAGSTGASGAAGAGAAAGPAGAAVKGVQAAGKGVSNAARDAAGPQGSKNE